MESFNIISTYCINSALVPIRFPPLYNFFTREIKNVMGKKGIRKWQLFFRKSFLYFRLSRLDGLLKKEEKCARAHSENMYLDD